MPTAPFFMGTYGDMVTLLFALFVILYSMSNMDPILFENASAWPVRSKPSPPAICAPTPDILCSRNETPAAARPFNFESPYTTLLLSCNCAGIGSNIVPALINGLRDNLVLVVLPARFVTILPAT